MPWHLPPLAKPAHPGLGKSVDGIDARRKGSLMTSLIGPGHQYQIRDAGITKP